MQKALNILFAGALLAIVGTGCATTVKVQRIKPAEINLSQFDKLAIGGVHGRDGLLVSSELSAALVDSGRFEVIDRQNLQQIMKEQELAVSDVVDENTSIEVGKLIGAAALLYGRIGQHDYTENEQVQKSTCTKGSGKKKYQYTCYRRTRTGMANVRIGFSVVDTSTGRLLTSKNFSCSDSRSTHATDGTPGPINGSGLLDGCRKKILTDFMRVIAPYKVHVKVRLEDDGDLPNLEKGNKFAQRGNWQKAIEYYTKSLSKAKENPEIDSEVLAKVHYNLGVAYGFSGRYDDGIKQLETAYDLGGEDRWLNEITRIKGFKADDEKLKQQGIGKDGKPEKEAPAES